MRAAAVCVVVSAVVWMAAGPAGAQSGSSGRFTDDDDSVHESFIEAIALAGVTRGCDPPANTRFCPDEPVTRSQMAAFLVRALDLPAGTADHFIDDAGSVFEADIDAVATAGIARGCDPPANTSFCPDQPVTRGQMAALVARGFQLPGAPAEDSFGDDDGSVFEGDIERIHAAGITKGCNPPDNDRYCPAQPVLRGEMASFLARAMGLPAVPIPVPGPGTPAGDLTVVFVAVRQGDAAIYRGPCGETGLVDTNRFRHGDVLAALDALGSRSLEWVSVSHYDADHLGGIVDVATAAGVTVDAVYDRGGDRDVKDTATYRTYYDWATGAGIRQPVDIDDRFTLCSGNEQVSFTVVSAGTDGTAAGEVAVTEENDRGVCLHVEYGDFDLATCGDVNGTSSGSRADVETAVAPSFGDVEVAKVNHHGSDFSSNPGYVDTLLAEVAVISVGANSFGHPDPLVVERWDAHGDVFQTQDPEDNQPVDGSVTVVTDGTSTMTASASAGARSVVHALDESG